VGEFVRDRLPDPVQFFAGADVRLTGPGVWKTGPCHLHGGSDSLRVNTRSGGWCCMNCGAKGGDVLAYVMQTSGLGFVQAAQLLGAYIGDPGHGANGNQPRHRATTLAPRDAMELAASELGVALQVMRQVLDGVIPNDADWARFLESCRRVRLLATEYRT
jgi:DNA primase